MLDYQVLNIFGIVVVVYIGTCMEQYEDMHSII